MHGSAGSVRVSTHPDADFVVSAIVGVAGLEATYEAVKAGKTVGLANKECLVAAGDLITAEARRQGKPLLPIDSEHNAIHQAMRGGRRNEVQRVWLTASGGPFLHTPASEFANITVEQALNHPTWKMGKRITIDSATLMNKGFEVIEACRLFDMPPSQVSVLVHPQSTIHSMVEFVDGSLLAQLSVTDMRLPILYALCYPDRIESDLRFPGGGTAAAGFPASRLGEISLLTFGLPGSRSRRRENDCAQCGRRGGGGGLPRRCHWISGYSGYNRSGCQGNASADTGIDTRKYWPSMRMRVSAHATASNTWAPRLGSRA